MKNILAENMRRFRTKNLNEQTSKPDEMKREEDLLYINLALNKIAPNLTVDDINRTAYTRSLKQNPLTQDEFDKLKTGFTINDLFTQGEKVFTKLSNTEFPLERTADIMRNLMVDGLSDNEHQRLLRLPEYNYAMEQLEKKYGLYKVEPEKKEKKIKFGQTPAGFKGYDSPPIGGEF
jgi:hypothetical protein